MQCHKNAGAGLVVIVRVGTEGVVQHVVLFAYAAERERCTVAASQLRAIWSI